MSGGRRIRTGLHGPSWLPKTCLQKRKWESLLFYMLLKKMLRFKFYHPLKSGPWVRVGGKVQNMHLLRVNYTTVSWAGVTEGLLVLEKCDSKWTSPWCQYIKSSNSKDWASSSPAWSYILGHTLRRIIETWRNIHITHFERVAHCLWPYHLNAPNLVTNNKRSWI